MRRLAALLVVAAGATASPAAAAARDCGSIAFERNTVCLFQTLSSRRKRGPSGLPLTRADLYR